MKVQRLLLRFFLCSVAVVIVASATYSQIKKPRPKRTTSIATVSSTFQAAAERRMAAFAIAWSTINETYFDPTFGGLDWNKIRREYEPRVRRAKSDAEFHVLLEEMLDRLGKSHLAVIVPEYFQRLEAAKKRAKDQEKALATRAASSQDAGDPDDDESDEDEIIDTTAKRYGIGVELRMIEGKLVISRVEKQSGATLAGLKPGYTIEKVNGVSIKDLISQALISGTSIQELQYLLPIQLVNEFLNGDPNTTIYLTCLDEKDESKEFNVSRLELAGEAITLSKNLPPQFLQYESTSLSTDVGYIRFNAFAVPIVGKLCDTLTVFKDKKAIVIDLRGNLGGVLVSMIGLSGMLTDKPLTLGTFVSRGNSQKFNITPTAKNFKGRLILLVDGQSMSATELFAAGLRSNDRAIVIGEKTGGQSLPAVWRRLPTGAVMMYPISDFLTLAGVSLEGKGLIPDHTVALDRSSLLAGRDVQLEKALSVAAMEKGQDVAPLQASRQGSGIGSGSAATPPKELKLTRITSLGSPPPVARTAASPTPTPITPSDERSLKIVADFAAAFGGTSKRPFRSYEVKGKMVPSDTTELQGGFYAAWESPDKILIELSTTSVGEVRTVYNGKESFQQTDYGLTSSAVPLVDTLRGDFFAHMFTILEPDYHRGLKYEGEYEVDGRLRHVLSATNPHNQPVGLSFYADTKLLATYSVPGMLFTFDDYRKVAGIMLPYKVELDRVMNVNLDLVTIDPKLDPALFAKKEKCFDKPD